MPSERYFISTDLKSQSNVSLEGQELHHFLHVMRTQVGEQVEIINGQGALAEAEVKQINKKHAVLYVQSIIEQSSQKNPVILAQAIPRINRLDYIVEKGTELGMTDLWLFPGALSERKSITDHQLDRLKNLSISAMKQSGRLWIPSIKILPTLNQWSKLNQPAFFGDVSKNAPSFLDKLNREIAKQGIIFFVGPESGFETDEENILKNLGAEGVKLHDNILRTDTAPLAALSLISYFNI